MYSFVTAAGSEALAAREVRARNEFTEPLRVERVHCPPEVLDAFHVGTGYDSIFI